MTQNELGDMPEPTIEPAEVNPGGADAMPENTLNHSLPADLPVELNPAVEGEVEADLSETEDTSTKATTSTEGGDGGNGAEESPA